MQKEKKKKSDSLLPDQVQSLFLSDAVRSGDKIFVFVVGKETNG